MDGSDSLDLSKSRKLHRAARIFFRFSLSLFAFRSQLNLSHLLSSLFFALVRVRADFELPRVLARPRLFLLELPRPHLLQLVCSMRQAGPGSQHQAGQRQGRTSGLIGVGGCGITCGLCTQWLHQSVHMHVAQAWPQHMSMCASSVTNL